MIAVAIGLALAAAVVHATWNVLVKTGGDPMRTFHRATVVAALAITPPALAGWLIAGRPDLPLSAVGFAAVSALLELAYLHLLSAAYTRGELSVVYPIARGSAPLLAVMAGLVIIGERLTPAQLAGVTLLLLGILAVTLPQSRGRATLPALLTGVSIAAYTAVDRVGVRLTAPWLYGWMLVVLLAAGLVISRRVLSRVERRAAGGESAPPPPAVAWRQALLIGLFMWGGYLLVLLALNLAPLSVVAPVRETAVVGVAVWGVWRLRERQGAVMKLAGALATVIGVALLAL